MHNAACRARGVINPPLGPGPWAPSPQPSRPRILIIPRPRQLLHHRRIRLDLEDPPARRHGELDAAEIDPRIIRGPCGRLVHLRVVDERALCAALERVDFYPPRAEGTVPGIGCFLQP